MARFVFLVKHYWLKLLLSLIHSESSNVTQQNSDSVSRVVTILFFKIYPENIFFGRIAKKHERLLKIDLVGKNERIFAPCGKVSFGNFQNFWFDNCENMTTVQVYMRNHV